MEKLTALSTLPAVLPLSAVPAAAADRATPDLLAVIQELNAAPDLKSGLERVAEMVRQVIRYDNLSVLLLDELGHELRYAVAVGGPAEVAEHWRFGMGQGIVGTVAQTRRPLRVGDVQKDTRFILAGVPVRSELAVPLLAKDRTVGVLDVGSFEPEFFTAEHERLLASLAGFLATAIEGAQLYKNMRDQAETLSILHEVSRELSSILDRGQLLEKVAERIQRLIDYDLFSVMLWNEESRLLEPWVSFQRDGARLEIAIASVPLGHGLSGTAAALRQAIRVPNARLDPRYVRCVSGIEVNSELVVPLVFKDRLLGLLDFESARYDAFSARHEQLLATLASSLAIALENALLYERLRNEEQRITDDLATARRIQSHLLPNASPWIPGIQVGFAYEPARHLGGDFYDLLPYGEGRLGIAVGDVAGKATPAALYGSFAIGILREYATHGVYRPAQVLADMNCKLLHLKVENRFLAMAFAVYDSADRTLILASSGLPYPHRITDGIAEEIQVRGMPLGLMPERAYDEMTLQLAPGDALVLCSDGIEESLDRRDEEFGAARLRETLEKLAGLSAPDIARGVLEAARRHSGSAEPSDDRTVVVLKVAG
jgi:sigma-B regulation protein RsbU (phosphoserine phosphatase)